MSTENNPFCFDIEGHMCLGSTSNPLSTDNMVFSFKSAEGNPGVPLPIGQFIQWLAKALIPGFEEGDLPTSLQQLQVMLSNLEFDGSGHIQISVSIGKNASGKWDSVWHPVSDLDFAVSDIHLKVLRKTS